ncbi:MAG: MerR family transcriptional regulator [Acidobacteria bacterium]|nr:MerR family transcriptional regulator [Acidobacteriota bacterium]
MSVPVIQGLPGGKPVIPDKLYFRIGEVAQLAGVEPYVLRYWETEFAKLMPKKSGSGHRLYRRKDVELVLELKRLLHEKRYTIEGARLVLEQSRKKEKEKRTEPVRLGAEVQSSLFAPEPSSGRIEMVRKELRDLISMLGAKAKAR